MKPKPPACVNAPPLKPRAAPRRLVHHAWARPDAFGPWRLVLSGGLRAVRRRLEELEDAGQLVFATATRPT